MRSLERVIWMPGRYLLFFVRRYCDQQVGRNINLSELLRNMPKESTHALTLKAQRLKIKEKSRKYPPGSVTLQVLGSGAEGAPRSLYLFTDQSRYLFNCGEGTQRLAHEHKMKLSKLEHIFITRGSWENVGGLPGVVLTIQDVGVPEITLHGPAGIHEIFSATKRFIVLKNLAVNSASCQANDVFEDNAIRVAYIPIYRESSDNCSDSNSESENNLIDDDIDYYDHALNQNNDKGEKVTPVDPTRSFVLRSKNMEVKQCVMCYAVRLQPRPGSLSIEKCAAAGVPPGPLLGRLKSGEDVVLDDGKVIRSADVTFAADPGPVFLVVECPDESYLNAVIQEPAFLKYQNAEAGADEMPVIIAHFTPSSIVNNSKYKEWMDKFSLSTRHLILNESNTCMGSSAVHRIQFKLNLLEPSIFPLLKEKSYFEESLSTSKLDDEFNIVRAKTFYNIGLRPRKPLDNCSKIATDPKEFIAEVMNIEGFPEQLEKLSEKLDFIRGEPLQEYPNIVFLGTGSCIPNKTRNTSGIILNISDDKCLLIDCGEGTYGQLVRFYGDGVDRILSNLKGIYVSHLHADHHIGLIGVLKGLARVGSTVPLYLLAPKQIMFWLNMYDRYFEKILSNVHLISCQDMLSNDDYRLDENIQKNLKSDLGLERVETTYVNHCPNAFGVTFKHVDGWKIAYSGDTMPSDSFVEIGKDCDLLIHEATMEDELKEEALLKLHSTTSEAIEVGRKMRAKFTMLTHFSQRYAKLPRLKECGTLGENVGIAFDNMKICFHDLPKLEHLFPALRLMFQEDANELETKAFKRQLKQEREMNKKQKLIS